MTGLGPFQRTCQLREVCKELLHGETTLTLAMSVLLSPHPWASPDPQLLGGGEQREEAQWGPQALCILGQRGAPEGGEQACGAPPAGGRPGRGLL